MNNPRTTTHRFLVFYLFQERVYVVQGLGPAIAHSTSMPRQKLWVF